MTVRVFGAVDVGASGGRVAAGLVDGDRVTLRAVHRFPNAPVRRQGRLRWDIETIFEEILHGLTLLGKEFPQVESVGIDTWGVDYGLLDEQGDLLADPVSYRDERTTDVVDGVHAVISRADLYAINGLQFLPFTTLYQLAAERNDALWDAATHVVLLPDLLGYRLTGVLGTEVTNASTTGLLDARTGTWSPEILATIGVDAGSFPDLRRPGQVLGALTDTVVRRTGLPPSVVVTSVGSHDTASAVVAIPAAERPFVYISSGTWSLVGTELDRPILSGEAMAANFTNERGVDGRVRFLRNVGGLWLLQESLRSWAQGGLRLELEPLLREAAALPDGGPLVDVDDPAFIAPGDMPGRIRAAAAACGESPPATPPAIARCIMDSLAAAFAAAVDQLAALCGFDVDVIHVVGGGSQNALLCGLTATRCGRTVLGGPAEATALGNVLVQARAVGAVPQDLDQLRRQLAVHGHWSRYDPRRS
ncbi:MAG: rhamnulokinase [Acidimicrobiales bacterium]